MGKSKRHNGKVGKVENTVAATVVTEPAAETTVVTEPAAVAEPVSELVILKASGEVVNASPELAKAIDTLRQLPEWLTAKLTPEQLANADFMAALESTVKTESKASEDKAFVELSKELNEKVPVYLGEMVAHYPKVSLGGRRLNIDFLADGKIQITLAPKKGESTGKGGNGGGKAGQGFRNGGSVVYDDGTGVIQNFNSRNTLATKLSIKYEGRRDANQVFAEPQNYDKTPFAGKFISIFAEGKYFITRTA